MPEHIQATDLFLQEIANHLHESADSGDTQKFEVVVDDDNEQITIVCRKMDEDIFDEMKGYLLL